MHSADGNAGVGRYCTDAQPGREEGGYLGPPGVGGCGPCSGRRSGLARRTARRVRPPANAESTSPSPARGPAPAEAKPAGVLYDSLEKEWANLLGRPAESASRVKVRHADLGQPPPAAAAPPAPDE